MRVLRLLRDVGYALAGLALLVAPHVLTTARGAEPPPHTTTLRGPVPALVKSVIDGDTFWVIATIWVNQELTTKVRIRDINAPEIGDHAKCAAERAKGEQARTFLAALLEGKSVELFDVRFDKFGGRVDARVTMLGEKGDTNIGELMVARGLAVADGARGDWCPPA